MAGNHLSALLAPIVFASLSLFGSGRLEAAPAIAPTLPIEEIRLANGIRFLLLARPGTPTVEAGWVVDVGSAAGGPGSSGLGHLMEHMMFKGSRTIGSRDPELEEWLLARLEVVTRELTELGEGRRAAARRTELEEERSRLERAADELVELGAFGLEYSRAGATRLNANTTRDLTLYYVTLPAERLELWFWLESDRLLDPIFRELAKEKRVVAEERRLRVAATPTGAADAAFDAAYWRATPYAAPTLGRPEDVEGVDRAALREFHRQHYRPERLVAVLVGNFDPDSARTLAERYFGRLTRGGGAVDRTPLDLTRRKEELLSTRCDCAPQVRIRYPTVPFGHQDEAALQALAGLLNGRGGRLYRHLVLGRELAFAAFASQTPLARAGSFGVTLEAKAGTPLETLVAAWDSEVAELLAAAPPADELRRTQRRMATEHLDQLKDPHYLLRRLLVYAGFGDWRRLADWTDRLAAVEPETIRRAARRYLRPDRRLVGFYESRATP